MGNFFKALGKGIIYVITLPLLLVFLAIYFVVSLFSFLVIGIKGIILFFKGENIVGDLKEDVEAKKRMAILQDPLSLIQQEIKKQEKTTAPLIDANNALTNSFNDEKPILQIGSKQSNNQFLNEPEEEKIVEIHEPNDIPIPEEEITPSFQDTIKTIEGNKNIKEVTVDNSHIIETDEYIGDMYKEEEHPSNTISSYDKED